MTANYNLSRGDSNRSGLRIVISSVIMQRVSSSIPSAWARLLALGLVGWLLGGGGGTAVWGQFYEGTSMGFGQNRIQTREYTWQYLPMGDMEVYYYQGGSELAARVAAWLPSVRREVETALDRTLEGPIQILVYNHVQEFRESNVGAQLEGGENIGGTARLIGSKLFLYGTGDTEVLLRDLRSGLARILFNQIMFGGQWQDALRNSSMLSFPEWYKEGLYRYVGQPWSAATAGPVLDAALRGRIPRIQQTYGDEAALLGHAVWKYIGDIFGPAVIANVLYMTRVSRSPESGFLFATGLSMEQLFQETAAYHLRTLPERPGDLPALSSRRDIRRAARAPGDLPIRLHRDRTLLRFALSPDGQQAVYATEERGQIRVHLVDTQTGKRTRVARHGPKLDRIQDTGYPVFAWHPSGASVTYTLESRNQNYLVTYDLASGRRMKKPVFRIDKILSMDFAPDGRTLVFSGVREGRSDLYLYQVIGNNHLPLWEDAYDDLDPQFSRDGRSIAFVSNRPEDLWTSDKGPAPFAPTRDVFLLDLDSEDRKLTRVTSTPDWDERQPTPLDAPKSPWTFLAENPLGEQTRMVAWRDSVVESIDTAVHYRFFFPLQLAEVLEVPVQSLATGADAEGTESLWYGMQWGGHLYVRSQPHADRPGQEGFLPGATPAPVDDVRAGWKWEPGRGEVDFRDYRFGPLGAPAAESTGPLLPAPNFPLPSGPADTLSSAPAPPVQVSLPAPRNYRLNYAMESVTSQLDNTFGNSFYQVYNGVVQSQPGLGGLTRISASDLFEDRRFTAGFRLSGSLDNSRYGLAFSRFDRRWDRTLSLERQGFQQITPDNRSLVETHVHLLRGRWTYPFDEVRSVRIEGTYRLDRKARLATDTYNLGQPTTFGTLAGGLLSYVHDATRERELNIREGTRAKAWVEYHVSTDRQGATFGTAGGDFRHYIPLFRNTILAVRAAANFSFGQQRLLHQVGGVDNSLSIAANAGASIDPEVRFAYQTRITPLRGFRTNARNGAHMALANVEIRLPIASTFSRRPAQSDFIRHFQVVGFADIGTAWTGLHPYSDENAFNQTTFAANPITVVIDNNHDPVIWATGFGLRSRLLGYWLRADWGFGVDDNRWQRRVFSLSLQLDF